MAQLATARVPLQSVLLIVLLAFVMGVAVAVYGPAIVASQRGRLLRLVS